MIADQTLVYDAWPEAIWADDPDIALRPEAFQDEDELDKVRDFLSSIAEIDGLTHLDFGADVRPGAKAISITASDGIALALGATKTGKRKGRR